jgi:hypothetical protein
MALGFGVNAYDPVLARSYNYMPPGLCYWRGYGNSPWFQGCRFDNPCDLDWQVPFCMYSFGLCQDTVLFNIPYD